MKAAVFWSHRPWPWGRTCSQAILWSTQSPSTGELPCESGSGGGREGNIGETQSMRLPRRGCGLFCRPLGIVIFKKAQFSDDSP